MAKILLVEDNEMNRDMLSRRLERRGYEVVIAVDGEQGVAMARAEAPDLILMDMSLPVHRRLGGDAAAQGRDRRRSAIPVIALTAHAMAGDREKALEAGCDDYDTKPIELAAAAREDRGAARARAAGRVSIDPAAPSSATSCARRSTTSSATPRCCSRSSRPATSPSWPPASPPLRTDARQLLALLNEVLARGQTRASGPGRRARHAGPPLERVRAAR